jgi:hypothetical protein
MKSLADFKRALTDGTVVNVVNHRYPELSGNRTVIKAQTNSICLTFPESHPDFGTPRAKNGSWLTMPKAKECSFNVDGSMTISHDGVKFTTITL